MMVFIVCCGITYYQVYFNMNEERTSIDLIDRHVEDRKQAARLIEDLQKRLHSVSEAHRSETLVLK